MCRIPDYGLLIIVVASLCAVGQCRVVTISNALPRLDIYGLHVDAHDGSLVQFGDMFYIFGTVYQPCHQAGPTCDGQCGYYNNTFALYESPDMVTWRLVSNNILPELAADNLQVPYWSPNAAFNKLTGMYYFTFWSGHYGFVNSNVAIATSSTLYGPYKIRAPITLKGASVISSTVGLFVDDDGTAYIRANTRDSPLRHVVERLTPDWYNTTGEFAVIFEKNDYPWFEGGGQFKRENTYYTMIGTDCCFCQWGGDAKVFTAPAMLGPWSYYGEVNYCADGTAPPDHVSGGDVNPCSLNNVDGTNFTVDAQQFDVATLTTLNGTVNMYYGERFRSSPDGIKSHDFQAWIPLEFNSTGHLQPMRWMDSWQLNVGPKDDGKLVTPQPTAQLT